MISNKPSKEEQIRNEVISTAQNLFRQYGFQKTTMEDIAKAMGRGKSTLYYYYKSKDEVFEDVIRNEIDDVFKKSLNSVDKVVSAEEKLRTYLSVSLKTIKQKFNLYNSVRKEFVENPSQITKLIKKFNSREIQIVKDILILGIEHNEFTSTIKEDIDLIAYSAVNLLRCLTTDLMIEEKFPNWDERFKVLISLVIKGIKT